MTRRRHLLGPATVVALMACGLFGGCQDDPRAPEVPPASGGDGGSGGAAGDAGTGGDGGAITCDAGRMAGAAGEAGAAERAEPFACTRSDAPTGGSCCSATSLQLPCGQAVCRSVPDLATCCSYGSCGWVAPHFEEELFRGCLPDIPAHPDHIQAPPPSYPLGVRCTVGDPSGQPAFCEADPACPAEMPVTGSECSAIVGRCHYCNPPGERVGPYSRSFECTDGAWVDLGASACGEPQEGGDP